MLISIIINYTIGFAINRFLSNGEATHAKAILVIGIIVNLAILIYYKYAGFLISSVIFPTVGEVDLLVLFSDVILPLGISFYTFQSISYIIDVYRDPDNVQKNLPNCALYISFFPQLVAGPIVRYKEIRLALSEREHSIKNISSGVELFIIGLFKKIVVANTISKIAGEVFDGEVSGIGALASWLALLCYSLQIYYDFSGYTDMARGLARMFGFELPVNFKLPYSAKSVQEFWRKWHITLSNWFRDYLYIPLGGNRVSMFKSVRNLWVVFLLCGLWHGASLNFVIWGAIHGMLLSLERGRFSDFLKSTPTLFQRSYLLFVVMISWVFFRTEDLEASKIYLVELFSFNLRPLDVEVTQYLDFRFIAILVLAIVFAVFDLRNIILTVASKFSLSIKSYWITITPRICLYVFMMLSCMAQLAIDKHNPFIYFRF
ncbi:MBOAT family O-acyltransferase [Pelagicoccus mobilis]|uniref:MBOAT family O-acyltransferase n=1 Tax=Pelagicoccus mobilis TaxID=415221 RepID=UPI001906C04F|nr:MBOAT family protein [Pelagicoccus mobilis]